MIQTKKSQMSITPVLAHKVHLLMPQVHDDTMSTYEEIQSESAHKEKTPDRVVKDMAFLMDSWENIA
jgi:hypothetical protein